MKTITQIALATTGVAILVYRTLYFKRRYWIDRFAKQ
jgi:hypothetical protein